jgi:hypothetical protein
VSRQALEKRGSCVQAARTFIQNDPNDDDPDYTEDGDSPLGSKICALGITGASPIELAFLAFTAKLALVSWDA